MNNTVKPLYLLIFVLALAVNFAGINTDFFSDDPGLYASIAKNMMYRHNLLQLFTYNQNWLDKPHFPFWAIWLSFKTFGISVWAYRLPALICFLLSALYTFLFSRKFYGTEIAITAVLILMTAQHTMLSNVDVRAEPYLMAFVTGAIYHVARLNQRFTFTDFLLAALLTAFAVMTKGIFLIGAVYGALLGQLVFTGRFTSAFRPVWVFLFLTTALFTLPEFYALYIQFDAHAEKVVFARTNVSGIKWFLWDSQFGRFVNNGPIKQKSSGSILFFAHTLLWAFLPWCLLFYYAIYKNTRQIISKIKLPEYYALSGGLLLLLLFSLSGFQLPFYTNAVFPLFAIVTAPYCYAKLSKAAEVYRQVATWLFIVALPLLIITVHIFLKPPSQLLFVLSCLLFGAVALVIIRAKAAPAYRNFLLVCCAVLFANFYMNTVFFNMLASYNGQITAASYINQPKFDSYSVYSLRQSNNVFQFYNKRPVAFIAPEAFDKTPPQSLFFANQLTLDQLTQQKSAFKVVASFANYPQENILPKFVNSATRNQVLDKVYIISH
ncbi:hypothetical protein FPZ43_14805 [Mucilaginibacter pallidiroseus]|uniref:Glycosyltransferase RgtA/B/C/D-like domain-containing protein n=1 Tax=Mucilaginibacter pallidiroseus TaxID=2599295 RepID=A0A563U4Z4_9SPHI|nr:glycosyltransferase family 39 protein [Mucilaginibacter pallidiroseus]TWR26430.1 hypothetical protein FPZ43_14805 [Mucilaginibacter pallidiroseus]